MSIRNDVTIVFASLAMAGALWSCRDDMPAPDVPELEESETVQFLVRNNLDQWTAARTDGIDVPADWSDLPRIDSVCLPYPEMFIRKDVDYPRHTDTRSPYMNPGKGEDPNKDFIYNFDDVEPYPGTVTYSLPLDVRSSGEEETFARLKVSAVPMTDDALSELRSLGREARRQSSAAGSRTTIVDKDNVADWYSNIGVSAVCFDGNLGWGYRADLVKTMDNELVSREGDRWKTTRGNYYWNVWGEDHNRVRFFAYAPYGTPGLTQTQDDADGTPRFAYTVAADVDEQVDLGGIAVTTPGNFRRTVPLRFDHILSGVRFLVDDSHMASCLRRVRIKGVHGSAIYKYSTEPYDFTDPDDTSNPNINPDNRPDKPGQTPGGQDPQRGVWTPTDAATATYTLDEDDFFGNAREPLLSEWSQEGGDEYWCVTDPDRMFMLMPQVLPESATIEATFVDDGETIVMEGRIGGKDEDGNQREWLQGHIYTYVITTYDVEYVLKLVKAGGAYPYAGGFDDQTVVSYARYYDKAGNLRKIVPVEWKPIFYDKNGNEVTAPNWVTVTYDRDPGRAKDYRPQNVAHGAFTFKDADEFARLHEDSVCCGHVQVMPQGALLNTPAFKTLRAAPFVGTEADPVNLAGIWNDDPSATISTANCYMINGPGYYNIPLVYGNAIKNGAVNPICWHSTDAPMKYGSPSFQNHLGNAIDNAYIKNCGATIHDAAIMSTFNQHAVQLVHLSDDYLTIYVDPEFIDQGSTVVMIRDTNGDIMWSWHLWLTYLNPYKDKGAICTVPTRTGETFEFMTANLGWHTNDGNGYTAARAIYWKPAQQRRKSKYQSDLHEEESGLYITKNRYRITQDKYYQTRTGFAPNYNWGRKDPLMRTVHRGADRYLDIRALYSNAALTTHDITNTETYTLNQGYYFMKQFTPGESVKVPWAIPTFHNLSWRADTIETDFGPAYDYQSNEGSTTNAVYVTWWTGNRDYIYRPGPVPKKITEIGFANLWPSGRSPNGGGTQNNQYDFTRYDDLWCINQDGLGYLSHEQGDRVPIKTVYDPCPPGFMVPPNRAFDNLNSSTCNFRTGMYSFNTYNLHFPAMPFLSGRIGHGYAPNGMGTNYYGVYSEIEDVPDRKIYPAYAYFYPFTESLYENTMTVWTADVSVCKGLIIGSFYNVTGDFIVGSDATLAANDNTEQMCGTDARSSGNLWSSGGRQVRAVREKQ